MKQIICIMALVLSVNPFLVAGDKNTTESDNAKEPAATTSAVTPAVQFVPLSKSQRFSNYVHSLADFQAVARTAAVAGIAQGQNTPKEWGGGGEGYGKRLGNAYAEHGIRETLQYGSASALHEDNRFLASGESGFMRRTRYAIASTFLARHDNGDRSFAFSRIGSAAAAAFIARAWQPRSTTSAGDGAVSFGITMGSDAGFNALREFWPGWRRHF